MLHTRRFQLTIVLSAFASLAVAGDSKQLFARQDIDFNRQIKPIFSDNCYACHGPDEAQRQTEFRVDVKDAAFADLGGYAAIVPGDVEASELITRILSDDPDSVMPPTDHRKKLTSDEKQLIVEWVKQGANWSEHWAFVSPKLTPSPTVKDTQWPINFIDHYILSRLEQQQIKPSPPADRSTLLRRLSFDLTGFPPTVEELESFDGSELSYQKAVERLLDNPNYGERMAVYWLDLVRYADSVGYHGDQPVSVTPYRDYVINAFNQNMPFDRFTKEQLAGDLVEKPTRDQLVASGYNRLGMMSAEGGVQPKEYLAKYASDRVRTTASVWLGVTLGCAECHDHKFDPFSTKEFYEFASFFADIKEKGLYAGSHESGNWGPEIEVPDESLPALLKPSDEKIAALESQLVETEKMAEQRAKWEQSIHDQKFDWKPLKPESFESVYEVTTTIADDQSILIGGENHNENNYVVTAKLPSINVKAIRVEVLPDASLPKQGPGRAGNGNFVITELMAVRGIHREEMDVLKKAWELWPDELKSQALKLTNASATVEQTRGGERHPNKKWAAVSAIDHDKHGSTWGWAILPEAGAANELVVQIADGEEVAEDITFVIQQYHGQGSHTVGKFRISVTEDANAKSDPFHSLPTAVKNALKIAKNERTTEQDTAVANYYVSIAPQFAEVNKQLADLKKTREQTIKDHTRTSLITVAVQPREMRVLARGNWMDKSGEVVSPNVPQVLGGPNWEGTGTRLQLAEWITAENNPLTARVFVNRLWRMFFGTGLSNVLDDLGSQGEPPSHPELLDRLAIEFIESGWDVKHLVRLLVSSRTYQQSSRIRQDLSELDPENRLLARQARFRLDAEFIRDHALLVSGLLVDQIGGRNGKPYQPPGIYRHLNFPRREYAASVGEGQYRRGLYTHWQRQFLHPAMKTFDAPAREECTAARSRSSTPLAALVLLNDPSYVEAARSLAERAVTAVPSGDEQRLNWIFLTCFSRQIEDDEELVLSELLTSHREYFAENPEKAKELLSIGQSKSRSELPIDERAAWTSVCRAVMNMHEFVLRK